MELDETRHDTALVIAPRGRLDFNTVAAFEQRLLERCAGEHAIVVDMAQVDYINSAGLRALLRAGKQLDRAGGRLVLCSPIDVVREVLKISGFDAVFEIHPDLPSAVASCR